jgi:hypothetical protein
VEGREQTARELTTGNWELIFDFFPRNLGASPDIVKYHVWLITDG